MKRKVVSILLIFALVFAFAGCKSDDPYELYQKASKNLQKAKSAEAAADFDFKMKSAGVSMEFSGDADVKYKENKSNDLPYDVEADINVEVGGQKVNGTVYFTDGIAYMDMMGSKIKSEKFTKKDIEDLLEESSDESLQITEKDIKEKTIEKADDGQKVHLVVDASNLMKKVKDTLRETPDFSEFLLYDFKMDNMTIDAVIDKDDNFKSQKLKMKMSMEIEKQKVEYEVTVDIDFENVGKDVNIDFPDFKKFKKGDAADAPSMPGSLL